MIELPEKLPMYRNTDNDTVVGALRITKVDRGKLAALLYPTERGFMGIRAEHADLDAMGIQNGGYLIADHDGGVSYCPGDQFEAAHERITD